MNRSKHILALLVSLVALVAIAPAASAANSTNPIKWNSVERERPQVRHSSRTVATSARSAGRPGSGRAAQAEPARVVIEPERHQAQFGKQ